MANSPVSSILPLYFPFPAAGFARHPDGGSNAEYERLDRTNILHHDITNIQRCIRSHVDQMTTIYGYNKIQAADLRKDCWWAALVGWNQSGHRSIWTGEVITDWETEQGLREQTSPSRLPAQKARIHQKIAARNHQNQNLTPTVAPPALMCLPASYRLGPLPAPVILPLQPVAWPTTTATFVPGQHSLPLQPATPAALFNNALNNYQIQQTCSVTAWSPTNSGWNFVRNPAQAQSYQYPSPVLSRAPIRFQNRLSMQLQHHSYYPAVSLFAPSVKQYPPHQLRPQVPIQNTYPSPLMPFQHDSSCLLPTANDSSMHASLDSTYPPSHFNVNDSSRGVLNTNVFATDPPDQLLEFNSKQEWQSDTSYPSVPQGLNDYMQHHNIGHMTASDYENQGSEEATKPSPLPQASPADVYTSQADVTEGGFAGNNFDQSKIAIHSGQSHNNEAEAAVRVLGMPNHSGPPQCTRTSLKKLGTPPVDTSPSALNNENRALTQGQQQRQKRALESSDIDGVSGQKRVRTSLNQAWDDPKSTSRPPWA